MSKTSENDVFSEIYDLILKLPDGESAPIFDRFSTLSKRPEWKERYNHEVLWTLYNEHLEKTVFDQAAKEYEETMRAMELWEKLR